MNPCISVGSASDKLIFFLFRAAKYQIRCRNGPRLQRITAVVISKHDDAADHCTAHDKAQAHLVHKQGPATEAHFIEAIGSCPMKREEWKSDFGQIKSIIFLFVFSISSNLRTHIITFWFMSDAGTNQTSIQHETLSAHSAPLLCTVSKYSNWNDPFSPPICQTAELNWITLYYYPLGNNF